MNAIKNSILHLQDLIDQAQNLLNYFQNNIKVALNPEPTFLNLDAVNYLKSQDNSRNKS